MKTNERERLPETHEPGASWRTVRRGVRRGLLAAAGLAAFASPHLAQQTYRVSQWDGTGFREVGCIEAYTTSGFAAQYYGFNTTNPFSAGLPAGAPTLVDDRAHLFLVDAADGLHLFCVFDDPAQTTPGACETQWTLTGDVAQWKVQDDTTVDVYSPITFGISDTLFNANQTWDALRTDGYVVGPLSGSWVLDGTFTDLDATIGDEIQGLTSWVAYSADGSTFPLNLALHTPVRIESDCDPRYNRIQLDNGFDELPWLNDPFVGSDPPTPADDLYWKCFPAEALRRCGGTADLMAIEYLVFDQDWIADDATLWAFTISESLLGTDTNCVPDFGAIEVLVPQVSSAGLGNPLGGSNCPPPNTIVGWAVCETFEDLLGNPVPLIDDMAADGTVDWSVTHYFPGGQSPTNPLVNSCGVAGNATLSWARSTDVGTGNGGENTGDYNGYGVSGYGGFQGGAGFFLGISEDYRSGAELALKFDQPTIHPFLDTDNGDGFPGPELGLAALHFPLGCSSAGVPSPNNATWGARIYDQTAAPGSDIGLAAFELAPSLPELGVGCIPGFLGFGDLGLNPGALFVPSLLALSVPFRTFATDPNGEVVWDSWQPPFAAGCGSIGVELVWQGWTYDPVLAAATSSTQLFTTVLGPNDGLP